jgi:hypothetical protein
VLAQPAVDVVLVVLLAPQQSGERLAHYICAVRQQARRNHGLAEPIRLLAPCREDTIEPRPERLALRRRAAGLGEAQPNRGTRARRQLEHVVGGDLRPHPIRVRRFGLPADDELVHPILHIRRRVRRPPQPLIVGLVLAEQQLRRAVRPQHPIAQLRMRSDRHRHPRLRIHCPQRRLHALIPPRPRIPKPQRRQQMQRRRIRPAVERRDAHQDVVLRLLGVLHDHIEIPILIEDPGIQQLVLHLQLAPSGIR